MKGFYITEVPIKKEEVENKIEKINNSPKIENQSAYLIKNKKDFEETTSKILNFMVGEETDFTDLLKIEDFYKQQTITYCQEFNLNKNDIKKKSDYLENIQKEIDEVKKNKILKFFYKGNFKPI